MAQAGSTERWLYSVLADDVDFRDLVADFVEDVPQRMAALYAALAVRDWDTLGRLAHQLKSALGSYGFEPLTPLAGRLESAVRHCADEAEIVAALTALRAMSERLRGDARGCARLPDLGLAKEVAPHGAT
jgi:HPt (histidine-containing phosphotransfer) domain-containing protein